MKREKLLPELNSHTIYSRQVASHLEENEAVSCCPSFQLNCLVGFVSKRILTMSYNQVI